MCSESSQPDICKSISTKYLHKVDEHKAAHEPGKEKDRANPGAELNVRNETHRRNTKAKAISYTNY